MGGDGRDHRRLCTNNYPVSAARFCSACGAELPSRPPVACSACGVEHWAPGSACANAIVRRADGRILLVLREQAPWRGLWCAPGGFANRLEPPEETTRREVREETGLDVRITGLLGVWVDVYADDPRDEDADWISVAYFAAEVDADEDALTRDPAEVAEACWFAPDALPTGLAPPATLPAALAAWEARSSGAR